MKTFIVPGRPQGYYAQGSHPNWTRMNEYHAYKIHVQECARQAGISLPLHSTKEKPLYVAVEPFFQNGVHCDPGNVQKGVCDALFWTPKGSPVKRGSDKFTGGHFPWPYYDAKNPRVVVKIYDNEEIAGFAVVSVPKGMKVS